MVEGNKRGFAEQVIGLGDFGERVMK